MAREVILGSEGIVQGARPGTVVADASTISPSQSRLIGQRSRQKCGFPRRSVYGIHPGATGHPDLYGGGDQAVFERTKPFFEPMGKRLYYCGGPGMGLQAKLTQNLILSNILMAFNEGMVLATKGGMDPQLMLDILDNSARQVGIDRLQGAIRLPPRLHAKLRHEVDA